MGFPWQSAPQELPWKPPVGPFAMGFPWQNAPQELPWRPPVPLEASCWPLCHGIPMAKCSPGASLEACCWVSCRGIPVAVLCPESRSAGLLEASCSKDLLVYGGLPSGSPGCVPEASFSRDLRLYGVSWRPSSLCFLDAGRPLGSTLASPNSQSPGGPRSKKEGSAAVGGAIKDVAVPL